MFSPSGIINYSYAHVSTPSICLPSVSLASVSVRIRISAVAEKKVHVENVCVLLGKGGGSSWDSRAIKPVCYLVGGGEE